MGQDIKGFMFVEIDVNTLKYKYQKTLTPEIIQNSGVRKLLDDEFIVVIKGCEYVVAIHNECIDAYINILKQNKIDYKVKEQRKSFTSIVIGSIGNSFQDGLLFLRNSALSLGYSIFVNLINLDKNISKYEELVSKIIVEGKQKGFKFNKYFINGDLEAVKEVEKMLKLAIIGIDAQLDEICRSNRIRYSNQIFYDSLPRSSYWCSVEYTTFINKYGVIFVELDPIKE